MDKINIKKVLINFIMVATIFLIDRLSKIYILKGFVINGGVIVTIVKIIFVL